MKKADNPAALVVASALLLAGCDDGRLSWREAPSDPQVRHYVFTQCLTLAKGPAKTHYNDWDEAIRTCSRTAARQAIYCPSGVECGPDIPSLEDVRAILPARQETQP